MLIAAIDPGCVHSAATVLDVSDPELPALIEHVDIRNDELETWIWNSSAGFIVIEMLSSYGQPVGEEVFSTLVWVGRFWKMAEHSGKSVAAIYRKDVPPILFGTARGGDTELRAYCLDRYGISVKKNGSMDKPPAEFKGMKSHKFQALALGLAVHKLLHDGIADKYYWNPFRTETEEFKEKKKARAEKRKATNRRNALKGQKKGHLVDTFDKMSRSGGIK